MPNTAVIGSSRNTVSICAGITHRLFAGPSILLLSSHASSTSHLSSVERADARLRSGLEFTMAGTAAWAGRTGACAGDGGAGLADGEGGDTGAGSAGAAETGVAAGM